MYLDEHYKKAFIQKKIVCFKQKTENIIIEKIVSVCDEGGATTPGKSEGPSGWGSAGWETHNSLRVRHVAGKWLLMPALLLNKNECFM